MSLQALMALLGHVTPEMTLCYASLASYTVRSAYDAAMAKTRTKQQLLVAKRGGSFVPSVSTGSTPRCSRPASHTGTAPDSQRRELAPTPTSANSATTL